MKRIERILADCPDFEFGWPQKNKKSVKIRLIRFIRFIRSPILRSCTGC